MRRIAGNQLFPEKIAKCVFQRVLAELLLQHFPVRAAAQRFQRLQYGKRIRPAAGGFPIRIRHDGIPVPFPEPNAGRKDGLDRIIKSTEVAFP